jgi:hypothetical protein
MGANAQTSVPLFVANAILTAQQQNISAATGVPVFATTVTRDAAFGGSNKVLAEGQLCYLESTDVVQYYTGAAWATVGPSTSAVSAMDVSRVNTLQSTSSTSYVGLTTAQVITMTTGTKAVVILSGITSANVNLTPFVSVAVSGATTTAASDANSAYTQITLAGGYEFVYSNIIPLTLTAGSNTFTMQARNSSASSASFSNRSMTVIAYS